MPGINRCQRNPDLLPGCRIAVKIARPANLPSVITAAETAVKRFSIAILSGNAGISRLQRMSKSPLVCNIIVGIFQNCSPVILRTQLDAFAVRRGKFQPVILHFKTVVNFFK